MEIPKKSKEITVHGKAPSTAATKDSAARNDISTNKQNNNLDFYHAAAASNQIYTKEAQNH